MLGERFNSKPDLICALNPDADFAKAGTTLVVPYTRPAQQLPSMSRIIVVDKSGCNLQLLDGDGKVIAQFPASTGNSSRFPLPIGDWKLTSVVQDPVITTPTCWSADTKPDPATPTGRSASSDGHQAALRDPRHAGAGQISRSQSSGCVRLTNFAAQAVATTVEAGTPVGLPGRCATFAANAARLVRCWACWSALSSNCASC